MAISPQHLNGHSSPVQLGLFPAVIIEAPPAAAAASSVVYTIRAYVNGATLEYSGVKPSNLRLDDAADTKPARVGDPCICFLFANKVYFWVIEQPDVAACE